MTRAGMTNNRLARVIFVIAVPQWALRAPRILVDPWFSASAAGTGLAARRSLKAPTRDALGTCLKARRLSRRSFFQSCIGKMVPNTLLATEAKDRALRGRDPSVDSGART